MVRMCKVTTFCLATAMVAGGALGADRAVKAIKPVSNDQPVTATQVSKGTPPSWMKSPMSMRAVNTVTSVPAGAFVNPLTPCVCATLDSSGAPQKLAWDNGVFLNDANSDGVASHLGGAYEHGIPAADDFYLCEGFVYKLNSITVQVVTNSLMGATTKAKLEL